MGPITLLEEIHWARENIEITDQTKNYVMSPKSHCDWLIGKKSRILIGVEKSEFFRERRRGRKNRRKSSKNETSQKERKYIKTVLLVKSFWVNDRTGLYLNKEGPIKFRTI